MKNIERFFGLLFVAAFVLGLFLPSASHFLQLLVVPCLILILYFSFLSIKTKHALSHFKHPVTIIGFLALYLLIIPVLIYLIVGFHDKTLAAGLMFIAAAPTGVAAPALTKIVKGNNALTLIFTVLTHFLVPFTLVSLFWMFTSFRVELELFEIFKTLIAFVFIPFILSSITKQFAGNLIEKTKKYYKAATIILISIMIYIVVGQQSDLILANPILSLKYLVWVYALFILMQAIGYFLPFWKDKKERIALSVSKTYINSALIIVLAHEFLPPAIILMAVLTEVPFSTLLGPFNFLIYKKTK